MEQLDAMSRAEPLDAEAEEDEDAPPAPALLPTDPRCVPSRWCCALLEAELPASGDAAPFFE